MTDRGVIVRLLICTGIALLIAASIYGTFLGDYHAGYLLALGSICCNSSAAILTAPRRPR